MRRLKITLAKVEALLQQLNPLTERMPLIFEDDKQKRRWILTRRGYRQLKPDEMKEEIPIVVCSPGVAKDADGKWITDENGEFLYDNPCIRPIDENGFAVPATVETAVPFSALEPMECVV